MFRLRPRLAALLAVPVLLAACSLFEPPSLVVSGETMGTYYSVTVAGPGREDQRTLKSAIEQVLARVNRQMSTYDSESELSKFNRAPPNAWFDVSKSLVTVIEKAQSISLLSDGAFDVTVGPLVNLWGFGPDGTGSDAVPDADSLARAMSRVGYRHLEVRRSPPAARKDIDGLYVDLSAIAKGFGVDQVAELLQRRGHDDYLVDIGGDLRTAGRNPDGRPWTVAIEQPGEHGRRINAVVTVSDLAVATSGDYRNYFEKDGKRYSHTIDPKTGRPIAHRLASVSVLSSDTMSADALATMFMVLGARAGLELCRANGIAAYFLVKSDDGYQALVSDAFRPHLAASDDSQGVD